MSFSFTFQVLVPLYDTLGPDACGFIINHTEAELVVVEDDKKVNLLLDKAPKYLKKLVVIKPLRPATLQRAKNRGVDVFTFEEVEKLGAQKGIYFLKLRGCLHLQSN